MSVLEDAMNAVVRHLPDAAPDPLLRASRVLGQPLSRVDGVFRAPREGNAPVSEVCKMMSDCGSGRAVVAPHHANMSNGFIGSDHHRWQLRFDTFVDERALPPLRLYEDDAIDAALVDPLLYDPRIVPTA